MIIYLIAAYAGFKWFILPVVASFLKEREVLCMYAIFETGGKQYKVQEGDTLFIEKLNAEDESVVTFDKVISVGEGKKLKIGKPYVKGASVEATVIKSGKEKKIIVYKMKPKKNYRRKQGHRQPYTKIQISSIAVSAPKTETKTED